MIATVDKMHTALVCSFLLAWAQRSAATPYAPGQPVTARAYGGGLGRLLSPHASITYDVNSVPRWSEFGAPTPGMVVNVATEQDVAVTVQFAQKNHRPFMAQSGGNGWIESFNLSSNGILINLRGLNQVTIAADKQTALIGGGAITSEVAASAFAADAQVMTGNCDCMGVLGAGLGGGYGRLNGMYGLGVDNILSFNAVLADGQLHSITPNNSYSDLWWAMRGAGPNFGIVTSAVWKAYPVPQSQSMGWEGALYFKGSQLAALVNAIQNLELEAEMAIFMFFLVDPTSGPVILVNPFYYGTEAQGRAAFKTILDIGPVKDESSVVSYLDFNSNAKSFCEKGDRKPATGAGFSHMIPLTWQEVWTAYVDWTKINGTSNSTVIVECYSLKKAQTEPTAASFPGRDIRFNAVFIPWYSNPQLDSTAETVGNLIRGFWRSTSGFPTNRTYINFGHGDEAPSVVYGSSTPRLMEIKKKYDPRNWFGHWFDLAG